MDAIFSGISFRFLLAYLDDLIVYSRTYEDHLRHLCKVFSRLRNADLKLKDSKCVFGTSEVEFLGHRVSREGIKPSLDKVSAISQFPVPKSTKEVRRFLGISGFYRKFVPNYGSIAKPLYALTSKEMTFQWSQECQEPFSYLKDALVSDPILALPNFEKEFILSTDASSIGIGCVLSQYDNTNSLKPVAYAGRSFTDPETRFTVTEQELLACVWAITYFKVYLEGKHFQLYTDHAALTWLLNQKQASSARLARWILCVQSYDFTPHHIQGSKNVVPDGLSRRTYDVTHTKEDDIIEQFPDIAHISKITADQSEPIPEILQSDLFEAQCHTTKTPVTVSSEPAAVNYVRARDPQLAKMKRKRGPKRAKQTPNEQGHRRKKYQDQLQATANDPFNTIDLSRKAITEAQHADAELRPLLDFLRNGKLPDNGAMARALLLRQEDYVIMHDMLYHIFTSLGPNTNSTSAQLVIPQSMKGHILALRHDSTIAGHLCSSRMLSVMRQRFYWVGMTRDIVQYVATCPTCNQTKRATAHIKPPMTLRDLAPHPWHSVSIDTVGALTPSQSGNLHLVVVVDYYSRAVIVWPPPSIDGPTIAQQFFERVICTHGCPREVSSDNGSAFISKVVQAMSNLYGLHQKFSSSFHPQTQGAVERANRSVLTVLRNYVAENQKDWCEYTHSIAFCLNSSAAYSTGHSPYFLLHGREPVLPSEINVPEVDNFPKPVRAQLARILQAQETGEKLAQQHMEHVFGQMKTRYDERATDVPLQPGDIVYLFVDRLAIAHTKKKLQALYHGPYTIVRFHTPCTVILKIMANGKILPKSVNVARLKKGQVRSHINSWNPIPLADLPPDPDPLTWDDLPDSSFDSQVPKPLGQNVPHVLRVPEATDPGDSSDSDDEINDTYTVKHAETTCGKAVKSDNGKDPPVWHDILDVLGAEQIPDKGLRLLVKFADLVQKWLPIEALDYDALLHYKNKKLEIKEGRNLRSR